MTVGTHPTAATHPGGTVLTSPPQDAPVDRATEAARRRHRRDAAHRPRTTPTSIELRRNSTASSITSSSTRPRSPSD